MHIEVLSLFPDYIKGPLGESILKRAIQKNLIRVSHHDIRDFSDRKDRRVDDRPCGGGPGMVLSPAPVSKAISSVWTEQSKVVYLSPRGIQFTSKIAKELSKETHLILLCGHYEGIDQRVIDSEVDVELSIGDYVLTNGCLAALVVIDALARFIPGVLGDEQASEQDSFEGNLLDCPHYTHQSIFAGRSVPEVLLTGNHEKIREWRRTKAFEATFLRRPDLLMECSTLPQDSQSFLCKIVEGTSSLKAVTAWYREMLGVLPQIDSGRATISFGQVQLTFVEKDLVKYESIWSFTLCREQFEKALRFGRIKKRCGIGEITRTDMKWRALFKDPDGRTIELCSFINI